MRRKFWTSFLLIFSLFLLSSLPVDGGINDARFQRLFRVDLNNVKRVSWKDWIKNHVQGSNGFPTLTENQKMSQISCSNGDLLSKHSTKGACCDVANDTCDSNANLQCIEYRCTCKIGTFLNENTGKCEKRNSKQLAETCSPDVDNCYAAFSVCISGVCQCMSGFKPDGLECVPSVYRCPYGDPLMASNRPRPCDIKDGSADPRIPVNSSSSDAGDQCSSGYECIYPPDPYRPRYISLAGAEKGYCCPMIPDLNQSILFQDQCYYGDWVPPLDCPPSTHVYATAISTAPLCCPKPCRPNYSSTIVNGQCLEAILS